jgi:muramoyltetrapeptide carboxypeptidase LdcA involved in peptidoglycan recycling
MIKPKKLKSGDRIAIVSLSWGGLGDEKYLHKYFLAKERLERDFHLEVVPMPHALKGSAFITEHPELRAQDLLDAFRDDSIAAIFSAIGGDDTIRLLPYIDIEVIGKHPKIFMGYSDTTANHLMMYKAGLVSFYGPSIMAEFAEYGAMAEYTKNAMEKMLFQDSKDYQIKPSPFWSDDNIPWKEENMHRSRQLKPDYRGYEILQGKGKVTGHLLGGCLDVFTMCVGTEIWPKLADWQGAILFVETSEDKPTPDFVKYTFRNLAAQGILKAIHGILIGKPKDETYYEEYRAVIKQVVAEEEQLVDLPIFYNVNFGHAYPIGILPYGVMTELDCEAKTITLLESATK